MKDFISFVSLVVLALAVFPLGFGVGWVFASAVESYWGIWLGLFGHSGLSMTAWSLTLAIPPFWWTWLREG